MSTILSDADVFGQAAPSALPAASGENVLTDAEVFGTGAPPRRKPRGEASIVLGGAGAGAKAVARNVADFGDMLLSVPGMAMGAVADVGSRIQSLAEGTDHRAAGRIAKEVRHGVVEKFSPTVLRQLTEAAIQAVAPDKKELEPTDVQKGMELITKGIEKGGSWAERKTGGLITAETFDSLVNEGMALGGIKGTIAATKSLIPKEKAPTPKTPEVEAPPAAPPNPLSRQAAIDATTGVAATRAARAARDARRKDAKEAFQRDPAYADQLRRFADEEARLRETAPPGMSAPGGMSQTGPRAARTGLRGAPTDAGMPPARTAAVDTGAPVPLDSALTKLRKDRGFDLTPEERIAMRAVRSQWGKPQMLDEAGKPLPPQAERGASTVDLNSLIAGLGLAAGLAAYAYFNQEDATTLALAAGSVVGAKSALGPLLKEGGYTLKTLERLPQNRTEFTKDQVLQQLNRADVSKAEKDLVLGVLADRPTVSAKELVEGFRQRGQGLELKGKETGEWADYGLDAIGRYTRDMRNRDEFADYVSEVGREAAESAAEMQEVPARTTLYRSSQLDSPNNHFEDPNYFAHTRSFDQGGVRHVVEIQSDVAQHAKSISPEARAEAKATYERLNTLAAEAERVETTFNNRQTNVGTVAALDKYEAALDPAVVGDVKMRLGERLWAKLGSRTGVDSPFDSFVERAALDADFEVVYDAAKRFLATPERRRERAGASQDNTYFNRVVESFGDAFAAESRLLARRALEAQARMGTDAGPLEPLLKNWPKRIIREELDRAARVGQEKVRFATADTVAMVEGWPDRIDAYNRTYHGSAEEKAGLVKPPAERFSSEHQSIYDRYEGDVEKFLRNDLGAKPYTDQQGHTWLEVPPQPRGPVKMFGRADLKAVATLAAVSGAALAADFLQDDPSLGIDTAAGLLAGAAVRARPRTAAVVATAAGVVAALSSEENRARNALVAGAVMGVASYAKSRNKVIAKWAADTNTAAEVVLGNLSAELRTVSQPLLRRFTAHEMNLKVREHGAMKRISPLAEGLIGLPDATRQAIDVALFTGPRSDATKLVDALKRPELSKALRDTFAYVDETGAKLDSLHLVKKLDRDHFPRIVTDLDGLMEALGKDGGDYLGRKLADAATDNIKRTGSPLSDVEMSRIVNTHLEAAIQHSNLGGQSGILKKRTIAEVTKDLLPFYATAGDSIALYARAASREIERARFFGRDLVQAPDTKAVNVGASIGQLVAGERASGKLPHAKLERLESILKARFGPGERSSHWLTQSYRNVVYAMLLGNPLSALVQFGDAAIATAVHGFLPTIQSAARTVTGKTKWKLDDFGLINHISEDLVIGSRNPLRIGNHEVTSAKFLDKMLKWSGFSFVDEFAKLIHLNAASAKFENLAKTPKGILEIERSYADYFGTDLPQLITDLRAKKKTPLVGELIFRELSDTQPITKLEMPEGYVGSPNGRVLYTLKSFMIKQLNLARERGLREIAKGDAASVRRGTSFLLRYSLALGMAGATVSYIQDWILGREPSFEAGDVAENVFKAFGWGEYAIDQARKGHALQSVANLVVPPYKLFEELWDTPEELEKLGDGDETANPKGTMYIPLVGKLIYDRLLGGADRANARRERQRLREEEDE